MHIVLLEPEIPQNTGNISRTCAILGATLHLIEPMGFSISDKWLKRAGLDYWDKLEVHQYPNWESFYVQNFRGEFYYFSTKASKLYTEIAFPKDAYLIFGKESRGLPAGLIFENQDRACRIPMRKGLRSLNLSNSVAVAAYELMRQQNFSGLC